LVQTLQQVGGCTVLVRTKMKGGQKREKVGKVPAPDSLSAEGKISLNVILGTVSLSFIHPLVCFGSSNRAMTI